MDIMLIDDDVSSLRLLAAFLGKLGHKCDMYNMPEKAVEAYKNKPYEVVITDLKMPRMNGIQVLQEVRSHDPAARVIIITGYSDPDTVALAFSNGAHSFFCKPISPGDILDALERMEGENGDPDGN